MAEEKKSFSWFFEASWEKVERLIYRTNTGVKMEAALRAVHSGKSYREAAKLYGLTKQGIYQWLSRTEAKINRGEVWL